MEKEKIEESILPTQIYTGNKKKSEPVFPVHSTLILSLHTKDNL